MKLNYHTRDENRLEKLAQYKADYFNIPDD